MIVLAIDTTLGACSAALLDGDALRSAESLAMMRGHAEALMPMIARVMDEAGAEFSDLDRIAVAVGPGSFTGIRVGVAAARGIAFAAGRPAVGISTLDALAESLNARDVPCASAVDARHGHFHFQLRDAAGESAVAPCVLPVSEVMALASGAMLTGTGVAALAAQWPENLARPASLVECAAANIEAVARLGARAEIGAAPRPLYLKPPDAKLPASGGIARR